MRKCGSSSRRGGLRDVCHIVIGEPGIPPLEERPERAVEGPTLRSGQRFAARGWSQLAIQREIGTDLKTIRKWLKDGQPGTWQRKASQTRTGRSFRKPSSATLA